MDCIQNLSEKKGAAGKTCGASPWGRGVGRVAKGLPLRRAPRLVIGSSRAKQTVVSNCISATGPVDCLRHRRRADCGKRAAQDRTGWRRMAQFVAAVLGSPRRSVQIAGLTALLGSLTAASLGLSPFLALRGCLRGEGSAAAGTQTQAALLCKSSPSRAILFR